MRITYFVMFLNKIFLFLRKSFAFVAIISWSKVYAFLSEEFDVLLTRQCLFCNGCFLLMQSVCLYKHSFLQKPPS